MKETLTENFTGPGTVFSFRFWAGSRYRIGWLVALLLLSGFLPSAAQSAPPALPQVSLDTNNAQPGHILSLAAGATFKGNFTLPNKSGSGWIVIRTSAPATSLPSPGTRITTDDAALMPKIVSPNTSPAISTAAAYGSPLEPKVVMLRHFRDHYLLTHSPGRALVKWYYRVSPPVAEAIRNSFMLRIATQITLWPLVALVWCVFNPETGVLVAFLVVVASAAGRDAPRRKSSEPFISGGQDVVEEKWTFSPQSRREIPLGHIPPP